MQGRTTGDVIAQAWREFVERHGDEFAADFERAATLAGCYVRVRLTTA